MRRLLPLLFLLLATAFSRPALADHLDGVVPLHKDDLAAVTAAKKQPDRHVLLYFGDNMN